MQSIHVDSPGPGNIVSLRMQFQNICEVIEELGQKRMSAERVADRAIKTAKHYLASSEPVGEYLADQLLLPMVHGAGDTFRTTGISTHAQKNAQIIAQVLPQASITLSTAASGKWLRYVALVATSAPLE